MDPINRVCHRVCSNKTAFAKHFLESPRKKWKREPPRVFRRASTFSREREKESGTCVEVSYVTLEMTAANLVSLSLPHCHWNSLYSWFCGSLSLSLCSFALLLPPLTTTKNVRAWFVVEFSQREFIKHTLLSVQPHIHHLFAISLLPQRKRERENVISRASFIRRVWPPLGSFQMPLHAKLFLTHIHSNNIRLTCSLVRKLSLSLPILSSVFCC